MGSGHEKCMAEIIDSVSKDGEAIRTRHLKCGNPLCPECGKSWVVKRVFEMTLRIEIEARERHERPFAGIMSVPQEEAEEWTIEEVNTSLFRRGYRRGRNIGIEGGVSIWHPYRIKQKYQKQLRQMGKEGKLNVGKHESKGMWDAVKNDALELGYYKKYLKIGMHMHFIGFGRDINGHRGNDFLIKIKGDATPDRMDMEEVMKYLYYVLTHAGHLEGDTHTNSTRRWGCCYRKPDLSEYKHVDKEWVEQKKHEIAEKLGMKYSSDRGLYIPHEEEDEYEWIPVWKVGVILGDDERRRKMNPINASFLEQIREELYNGDAGIVDYEKLKDDVPDEMTVIREPDVEEAVEYEDT